MPTANKLFPFLYLADLSLSKLLLYGLQQNLLFSSTGIFSSKEWNQKKINLKNILAAPAGEMFSIVAALK